MVCNACGHETQDSHLFCGTCGTSLPHPPFAVPGAESTLSFTRIPQVASARSERQRTYEAEPSKIPRAGSGVLVEVTSPSETDTGAPSQTVSSAAETAPDKPAAMPETPAWLRDTGVLPLESNLADELPARELVPEISLDEYVRQFHYEPPSEPEEVTMRGDAAPVKAENSVPSLEPTTVPKKTAATVRIPIANVDAPERLSSKSVGPAEAPHHSSGFPVIHESPLKKPDLQPAMPAAHSFPRASQSSEVPTEGEAAERPGGRWRVWFAVAAVAVFAALAMMEWHARFPVTRAPALDKGNTAVLQHSTPTTQAPAEKPSPTPGTAQKEDPENTTRTAQPGEKKLAKSESASTTATRVARLRQAAAKGNKDAPVELANLYLQGNGVPRSCDKAMLLLKSAAAKGNVRARNQLASIYAIGTCAPRNRVQAYFWLSSALAADPDNYWAQQNRELTWRQMTPEERIQVRNNH